MEYNANTSDNMDDEEPGLDLNKGLVYTIKYDEDDYFRDNKFYKSVKPKRGPIATFAQMREELDSKYMDCMSDKDLAEFLIKLDEDTMSGMWDERNMQDWIVKKH